MSVILTKNEDGTVALEKVSAEDAALAEKALSDEDIAAIKQHFKDEDARAVSYIKIVFMKPQEVICEAYQVISGGRCIGFKDLDGNDYVPPEVTESRVVEESPKRPKWA